ncbi:hypothetical protein GE061_015101 [Apolygus lucorum]|uniref:Uncharacterized protein n=1 Tax=Apolygus lucorum TaxID=248454 RepID=A0A8S9XL88_APOLU|nr:hypothetical protein GE061_015101 [Apolygus lucorum]
MDENHGLDTQLLVRLLKKRFHDEKPQEITSIEVKNAVPKGDNYASLVYRIKMKCLTAAGKKRSFSVIVKMELTADSTKELFKSFPVFRVETRVYTSIIPMMEELMEEFGDKREKLWPNILGYQPYHMIAFNDLSFCVGISPCEQIKAESCRDGTQLKKAERIYKLCEDSVADHK